MAVESVRYLSDAESMEALVDSMPPAELNEYQRYKHRALDVAFPGRVMVVYTFDGQGPVDIQLLKVGDMQYLPGGALTIRTIYQGEDYFVSHTPVRLADRDVFLSVPQNFVLKWCGQVTSSGLQFRPQFAFLVKTRSKEDLKVRGVTHCVTLKRFLERYPNKADEVRF